MHRPTLYLMLGYPGAGKTTVSKALAAQTGATHIWADHERRAMFQAPTHSKEESDELYKRLNEKTDQLLATGHSVIFDTSFNHFSDRERLRSIAATHSADIKLIWLTTPLAIAKARATDNAHAAHNKYEESMSPTEFDRIASHLEPPRPDEQTVQIDGSNLDSNHVVNILRDHGLV